MVRPSPQAYEYIITGFLFGLVVAIDIMCIINTVVMLLERKKKPKRRKSDLPKVYRDAPRRQK